MFFRRSEPLPPALASALARDEHVMGVTPTVDGAVLAASRFGLWQVRDQVAERFDWHVVSKARLAGAVLGLTVADEIETWDDGTVVLRDRPEVLIRPVRSTKLTDAVHDRVRRSVAASRHVPWPGGGGWVVLRRVPGRDGLTIQLRLDVGSDGHAPGFAGAVRSVVSQLWPAEVPRGGDYPGRND